MRVIRINASDELSVGLASAFLYFEGGPGRSVHIEAYDKATAVAVAVDEWRRLRRLARQGRAA